MMKAIPVFKWMRLRLMLVLLNILFATAINYTKHRKYKSKKLIAIKSFNFQMRMHKKKPQQIAEVLWSCRESNLPLKSPLYQYFEPVKFFTHRITHHFLLFFSCNAILQYKQNQKLFNSIIYFYKAGLLKQYV